MDSYLLPLSIFFLGLVTGLIDGTIGNGGLLSIPMLIFLGLPPQAAIATDRLGTLGERIGAWLIYHKAKKIIWSYVPLLAVLGIVGGIIGANLLLAIDGKFVQKIIGLISLLTLPLILIHKHAGVKRIETSGSKKIFGAIFYFLLSIYNGFLGAGASLLSTYNQTLLFGFTILESNATTLIPWFLLSFGSVIIFTQHNLINYTNGFALVAGMLIGGYIGAHTLVKIGDLWVKRLFIVVVVLSAIRLLFF